MLSADELKAMLDREMSPAEQRAFRAKRERERRVAEERRPQREYQALPIQTAVREHNGQQISYRLKLSLVEVARRYKLSKPTILARVKAKQFPLPDFKEKGLDYWTDTTLAQYERDR